VGARDQAAAAVQAGCPVVAVTIGARSSPQGVITSAPVNEAAIAKLVSAVKVPVLAKGVRTPQQAAGLIGRGVAGVIVSGYPDRGPRAAQPTVTDLPAFVERTGKVPLLVDGSFRRGTDILKALAFGATAVMVGRPIMWGLAAYGSEGVQGVLEMLQTELARYSAMSGRPNLAAIDRTLVRLHTR
jgi:4-hydroxymandelate oxidase